MPVTQRIDIDSNEAMLLKIIAAQKQRTIAAILADLVRKFIAKENGKGDKRG